MKFLVIALVLGLGACSVVQNDVGQVQALATAVGDTQLATCAKALGPMLGQPPSGSGLLYAAAVKVEAAKLFQPGGVCEGVSAEVATQAIEHLIP